MKCINYPPRSSKSNQGRLLILDLLSTLTNIFYPKPTRVVCIIDKIHKSSLNHRPIIMWIALIAECCNCKFNSYSHLMMSSWSVCSVVQCWSIDGDVQAGVPSKRQSAWDSADMPLRARYVILVQLLMVAFCSTNVGLKRGACSTPLSDNMSLFALILRSLVEWLRSPRHQFWSRGFAGSITGAGKRDFSIQMVATVVFWNSSHQLI